MLRFFTVYLWFNNIVSWTWVKGEKHKTVHPTQIIEYTNTIVKLSPYINAIFLQMDFFGIGRKSAKPSNSLYSLTTGK